MGLVESVTVKKWISRIKELNLIEKQCLVYIVPHNQWQRWIASSDWLSYCQTARRRPTHLTYRRRRQLIRRNNDGSRELPSRCEYSWLMTFQCQSSASHRARLAPCRSRSSDQYTHRNFCTLLSLLNVKKLTSLQHRVRAINSQIQNGNPFY